MTDQPPIRFRTFADEDDRPWMANAQADTGRPADHTESFKDYPSNTALPEAGADRRRSGGRLLLMGTGAALVAGVALAIVLLPHPGAVSSDTAPADNGLQIHRYVAHQPGQIAVSAVLPCYVNGLSVGSLTLAQCGQRNGVASGRLDVGLRAPPADAATANLSAAEAPTPVPAYRYADSAPARGEPLPRERIPAAPVPPRATVAAQPYIQAPAGMEPQRYAALAAPVRPIYAPPRDDIDDQDSSDDSGPSADESLRATQTFYQALGRADGYRAASVVVPEKRRQGPLSADAISRFYSGLRDPLRLTRLDAVSDHAVVAHYTFVTRDGSVCRGAAQVTTANRDGQVYVQGVRALNGC